MNSRENIVNKILSLKEELKIQPKNFRIYVDISMLFQEIGDHESAVEFYSKSIELNPNIFELYANLAHSLKSLGRYKESLEELQKALKLKPNSKELRVAIANILKRLGQFKKAENLLLEVLKDDEGDEAFYNTLGTLQLEQGKIEDAIKSFQSSIDSICKVEKRKGIIKNLKVSTPASNLLLARNYLYNFNRSQDLELAIKFKKYYRDEDIKPHIHSRKISSSVPRLGFVSPDLRDHPVGRLLIGPLKGLRQQKVHVTIYSDTTFKDKINRNIMSLVDSWRETSGIGTSELSNIIKQDKIDILIDLSGHTAKNRLEVFALKSAPIQASWLGYFATTGLKEIDYVIGDPHTISSSGEKDFIENPIKLPNSHFCFNEPEKDIEITKINNSYTEKIVFGSFNNYLKINDMVLETWAKILLEIPKSILILKNRQLASEDIRSKLLRFFYKYEIEKDRIILLPKTNIEDYFNNYNKIDISLDTFPFPGGMTTLDSIWMGTPVITLKGQKFISHNGESIMNNLGLEKWIAYDKEDYVKKAIKFSTNLDTIRQEKRLLREKLLQSNLSDTQKFGQNFYNLMIKIIKKYNMEI